MTQESADVTCNARVTRVFQAHFIRNDGFLVPCGVVSETQFEPLALARALTSAWPGAEYCIVCGVVWRN